MTVHILGRKNTNETKRLSITRLQNFSLNSQLTQRQFWFKPFSCFWNVILCLTLIQVKKINTSACASTKKKKKKTYDTPAPNTQGFGPHLGLTVTDCSTASRCSSCATRFGWERGPHPTSRDNNSEHSVDAPLRTTSIQQKKKVLRQEGKK